jgi:nucleotide-binding universal stress UspA family protein
MTRIDIKHILCPVDLSEPSRHAFQHALALARWYSADVTLLEVLWDALPPVPFDPAFPRWRGSVDDARAELRKFGESVETAGVQVTEKLFEGPVVTRILDEAERLPADLIVIGTHGASGFEHLMLGSVTEKLLRKARCPVWTVPPSASEAPKVFSPFKTVLCAVDFSPASMQGLEYAMSLVKESGGRLVVAHVVEWVLDDPERRINGVNLDVAAFRRQLRDEAARRLTAAVPGDVRTWCEVEEVVATGRVHEEVLRLAAKHHADAIVLGVHGRTGIGLAFLGSTANHVVRAATCPVLTVRT